MQWSNTPRTRASNSQRGKIVGVLADALADGRLSDEEYQTRQADALAATYIDELDQLVSDLGTSTSAELVPTPSREIVDSFVADDPNETTTANLPAPYAREGEVATRMSVGIMGGTTYTGRWAVASNHFSLGLMGGNTIDLREAVFTAPVTRITAVALMGGIEVIVPPDMNVKVEGAGIMGGFGWDEKSVSAEPVSPDGPTVIINGIAMMGGVEVVRKRRGQPIED